MGDSYRLLAHRHFLRRWKVADLQRIVVVVYPDQSLRMKPRIRGAVGIELALDGDAWLRESLGSESQTAFGSVRGPHCDNIAFTGLQRNVCWNRD